VCCHPDEQRQGLGAALTLYVAHEIRSAGEEPFLHVLESNTSAIRLYRSLGFATRRMVEAVAAQWVGDTPEAGA
jgi:ribosomal protein S18 acetylase RimI-like enzyme